MTNNTSNQAALKPIPSARSNGDVACFGQTLNEKGIEIDAAKNSLQVHGSQEVLEARLGAIEGRFEALEGKVDKMLDLLTRSQFSNQNVTVYTSATAATPGMSDPTRAISMRTGVNGVKEGSVAQGNSSFPNVRQVSVHAVCAMHILDGVMVHAMSTSGIGEACNERGKRKIGWMASGTSSVDIQSDVEQAGGYIVQVQESSEADFCT